MALITLFTAPKPFANPHIAMIQRNALHCWRSLGVEVLVIGEEAGLAAAVKRAGVRQITGVARNPQGTPLVSSIFELARQNSDSPLLAYVNADILLLPDFVRAAQDVLGQTEKFLIVGQRWDLDVREPLDFSPGWDARLRAQVRERGRLHPPAGSDYFIFPRACFTAIPDFAVGRAGWDNWMIYQSRREGLPTIDATRSATVVHQDHDYSHLPEGQSHRHMPETDENIRLAGGRLVTRFSLLDSNWRLQEGRLRPAQYTFIRFLRGLELFLAARNDPPKRLINSLLDRIYRWRVKIQR